jgi:hypothetical protein
MGTGHWDYRGIKKTNSTIRLPVAQLEQGSVEKCVEDFFACLTPGENVLSTFDTDIFLGRLPCATVGEAQTMVDKIIETENTSQGDFSGWRNRSLLVADDDMQGASIDPIHRSTPHYRSSDLVADAIAELSPSVDVRKVYLFDYEPNEFYEKPAASQALINEINNGVSCVNYFGHGAHDLWADEHILTKNDLGSLHNDKRYPMVNSFSCSVGKFDDPETGQTCLSAILMRLADAGALVTISSTRLAYAQSNERLAVKFYEYVHDTTLYWTVGQAYAAAKIDNANSNHRAYALLGDPSIRYVTPTHRVAMHIDNAEGNEIDTLMALQKVTVVGTVVDIDDGERDTQYGTTSSPASVLVSIFNPPHDAVHIGEAGDTIVYEIPGNPLFVGQTQVRAGQFEQVVLFPRNVAFDVPGVKLNAYVWRKGDIGTGHDASYIFDSTDAGSVDDTIGPVISVRPVYDDQEFNGEASFTDALVSALPMSCEIHVYDGSGVDVVGAGPGEGLTLEIPGALSKRNINNTFQFDQGDYRRGKAPLVLEEEQINTGQYTMVITAQDLLGNMSTLSVDLEIVSGVALNLNHVFNHPNPMRMRETTRFYFHTSHTADGWEGTDADITLRIYTLSGKLIRLFRNPENGMEWDGTDQFGNVLSPNVYLYQVAAKSLTGLDRTEKSPIRKLVIHPPRRNR